MTATKYFSKQSSPVRERTEQRYLHLCSSMACRSPFLFIVKKAYWDDLRHVALWSKWWKFWGILWIEHDENDAFVLRGSSSIFLLNDFTHSGSKSSPLSSFIAVSCAISCGTTTSDGLLIPSTSPSISIVASIAALQQCFAVFDILEFSFSSPYNRTGYWININRHRKCGITMLGFN